MFKPVQISFWFTPKVLKPMQIKSLPLQGEI